MDAAEFQSTHPAWGATRAILIYNVGIPISIHAPRVGCDGIVEGLVYDNWEISIHAPRVGCDCFTFSRVGFGNDFNPRTPRGVRRLCEKSLFFRFVFQSTHPAWGATLNECVQPTCCMISIHAPRVGCDPPLIPSLLPFCNFNPRTPRGVRLAENAASATEVRFQSTHPAWGATEIPYDLAVEGFDFNPRTPRGVRPSPAYQSMQADKFQSTHPAWGATPFYCHFPPPPTNFNPRTPRGVRHRTLMRYFGQRNFNPRTPRGVRRHERREIYQRGDFNPRTPRGVRRGQSGMTEQDFLISIHAPRVGCDVFEEVMMWQGPYFNPRTPRGVRPRFHIHRRLAGLFQSTHPAWGATRGVNSFFASARISIHAPRVGCDYHIQRSGRKRRHFNPRTPRGVRHNGVHTELADGLFQSTHPAWGATSSPLSVTLFATISIHAPRVGCDTARLFQLVAVEFISIHAPRVGCDFRLFLFTEII